MGENRKLNWHIGIPIVLWMACIILGMIKVSVDEGLNLIELIRAFNSNTFSTFLSVVVCMLYQYFSTEKVGLSRENISGLSMKNIPATIIISIFYGVVSTFNSAISHLVMEIIFLIVNILYVVCFFCIFLVSKKERGD